MHASPVHRSFSNAELWAHIRQDRRYIAMTGLAFATGIPYQLVYDTQSAWWSEVGLVLGVIGLLGELAIAYQLKFLWAPFLDSFSPPLLGRAPGRGLWRPWPLAGLDGVVHARPGVFGATSSDRGSGCY